MCSLNMCKSAPLLINGFFAWDQSHCFHYQFHQSVLDNTELSVPDGLERKMPGFVQNVFHFIFI